MEGQGIMLADFNGTYEFLEKVISTVGECFKTRKIHFGMDDAYLMGRLRHLDIHGFEKFSDIFFRHATRLNEIGKKYGYECEIWSEMLITDYFKKELPVTDKDGIRALIGDKLPSDMKIVYQNYYDIDATLIDNIAKHNLKFTDNVGMCATILKGYGFTVDNAHSIKSIKAGIDACRNNDITSFYTYAISRHGGEQSIYNAIPSLYFASEYANGRATGLEDLDKAKFKETFGVEFDDFMLLDLANKPHDDFEYTNYNCKSYFYAMQDLLLGPCDGLLSPNTNVDYAKQYEKFNGVDGGKFQYWFDIVKSNIKVLKDKAELGIQLQKAYKSCDKKTIKYYAKKIIPQIIESFDEFYAGVQKLDKAEFEGNSGFEIINYRFGGAKKRLNRIAERLLAYANGKIDFIEELEDERLPIKTFNPNPTEDSYLLFGWNILTSFGLAT